jgi:pimeloyl-ACP methyl ester carboxylesterase
MLAADLAVFRPEAVTRLVLLAPLGLWDADQPGEDLYAMPEAERLPALFHGPVPDAFRQSFAAVEGMERNVAQYLSAVAAASLVWPIADHGLAQRIHRLRAPTLVLWGEKDRIAPCRLAGRWPAERATVVPGAGHLLEWDAPEPVAAEIGKFLHA